MLRNYLAAALGNLARNRLYAVISIAGLAVAFTVGLLVAVYVRNEFSYDHFIPGYRQVYRIAETWTQPGNAPIESDYTQSPIAAGLRTANSGLIVARLVRTGVELRRLPGDARIQEFTFAWVDPDFFKVMPLPVLYGSPEAALRQPNTVVLTQRMARKYFGRDNPIGETLEVIDPNAPGGARPILRVAAVLKDLPPNTHLDTEVYGAGQTAGSALAGFDARPSQIGELTNFTYVRLQSPADLPALQASLGVALRSVAADIDHFSSGTRLVLHPVAVADIHLRPAGSNGAGASKPRGDRTIILAIASVGVLIVLIASLNFVTLMTARSARRAVEVGVRKVMGAGRSDLLLQFMAEALLQVALATLLALALAELLIKPFGAFVQRGLDVSSLHQPMLLAGLAVATLIVGLLAGLYPALVLSAFRPASVLKGGAIQAGGSARARQALVVVQFAIVVGLMVATVTIYRQTVFALHQGQGAHSDHTFLVITDCKGAFPDAVRRLPGVQAAACSSFYAINSPASQPIYPVQTPAGRTNFNVMPIEFGYLEFYGVKPIAGRLFSRDHAGDQVAEDDSTKPPTVLAQPPVIVNETAARRLGFADPAQAVGHTLSWPKPWTSDPTLHPSPIVGVVPDRPISVRTKIEPTFFFINPPTTSVISIRLSGRSMAGVVRSIERAWRLTGHTEPFQEVFLSQYRQGMYLDILVETQMVAVCSALAIFIAGLGLFALSTFIAERRTKEIGIRKVMGASTTDIVLLLLWQFSLPILLATAIAWPLAFLAMRRWLDGFAYHVGLPAWVFLAAGAAALLIACLTVSAQAFAVARARPAGALRYE
jgi:putative ABC transport system permease protein